MKEAEILYKVIEKKFGVTKEDLHSRKRNRFLVDLRRIFSIVMLDNTNLTLEKLAKIIGRDHSVIIHYKKTFEGLVQTDVEFKNRYKYVDSRYKFAIDDGDSINEKYQNLLKKQSEITKEIERVENIIEINKNKELCA